MVELRQDNPERPWQNALNATERDDHARPHHPEPEGGERRSAHRGRELPPARARRRDPANRRGVAGGVLRRSIVRRRPYAEVESSSARRSTVSLITGYLDDLSWLADSPHHGRREQLIRARLSLQLLPDELVDAAE